MNPQKAPARTPPRRCREEDDGRGQVSLRKSRQGRAEGAEDELAFDADIEHAAPE